MTKAEQLRELEDRAKNSIEALFLAFERGQPTGLFESSLEASIDAARALTRKKKRRVARSTS